MPGKTSSTKQDADTRNADRTLAAYLEVCRSYRAVDDFRGRLLAALPIVSGTGGILLLANQDVVESYLGAIGLFGVAVTVGLFCYELRGLRNCGILINTGRALERELRLYGQFLAGLEKFAGLKKDELEEALESAGLKKPEAFGWRLMADARTASWIVYLSVIASWIFIACVGFGCIKWLSPPAVHFP